MTAGRLKIWNEDAGEWQYTPGGETVTVKHIVVPVEFTDIDTATGFADLYLLPEDETVLFSWMVVTTVFDGATDPGGFTFTSAKAWGPGGTAGEGGMGDTFDATTLSSDNANDGLIGPDPSGGTGSTTPDMIPMSAPVPGDGPVQLVVDFGSGPTAVTQGTQGHLDYHLVIAVAP